MRDALGAVLVKPMTPFLMTGHYYDADVGIYITRYRAYSPDLGRWLTRDPIAFSGGDLNLYTYVNNRPSRFWDPFGLLVEANYNKTTGTLTVTDVDTGETVSARAKSGQMFLGEALPSGDYDILDQGRNSESFRLEPKDDPYGDDTHNASGRNEFRLHEPGLTEGCIAVSDRSDWNDVRDLINKTTAETSTVDSKWRLAWFRGKSSTEKLKNFGTLKVVD